MLLCVKQMSAERAAGLLSLWQTPRELHEWLREQEGVHAERGNAEEDSSRSSAAPQAKGRKKKVRGVDMVFADSAQGEGRQKIGDQLSKDVSLTPFYYRLRRSCIISSSYTRSLGDQV